MGSLEEIGALLGLVAFAGLAVLVFLTIQQARHLRRLRDWAGRAPERAAAAAEAAARSGEESVDPEDLEAARDLDRPSLPRLRQRLASLRSSLSAGWAGFDRRMPVEPKLLVGGLTAVVLGVGIATSGFGVLSDDAGQGVERPGRDARGTEGGGAGGGRQQRPPTVAVLNGTAPPGGVGVAGVAERVSQDVEAAGFRIGPIDNAESLSSSVIMFSPGSDGAAEDVADALSPLLGPTTVAEMTSSIEEIAGNADVAVVVGRDHAGV